nr:ATP synthase F0 subunit 6 [Peloridora minuta]
MMTSLFSSFDPTTPLSTQLNWSSSLIIMLFIPINYLINYSPHHLIWSKLIIIMHYNMKELLNHKYMGSTMMMVTLFTMILLNNLLGLCPYVFTSSSHIIMPLSLSIPLWLSFMLFGWMMKTNHKFAHLVPEGTPNSLMPFTVMIETLSGIIRPGVVALRLTTNMLAGHFLLTLLGNNLPKSSIMMIPAMISMQSMLMMFEMMVSLIQAYVFSILISLYFEE